MEHPFDGVKTRLQAQALSSHAKVYDSSWKCLRQIVKQSGVIGLYNGLPAPLVGSIAENAVLFASYAWVRDRLNSASDSKLNSHASSFLAGLFGGFLISFILTPVELVKCRMQVQGEAGRLVYRNSWHCVKSVIKNEGLCGLFTGSVPTFWRESLGCAAWFSIYEGLIEHFLEQEFRNRQGGLVKDSISTTPPPTPPTRLDLPISKLLFAGAASGLGFNLIMFPADVIKSQMQVSPSSSKTLFLKMGKDLFRAEGIRGLYRGCLITCIRSVPTSASMFFAYEWALSLSHHHSNDHHNPN